MFTDQKTLHIKAGKGGDGVALFRREIYVPKGGPSGGDGGNGGSIYIEGARNLHALSHLAHINKIDAEPGGIGSQNKRTGKDGEDQTILVPLGTQISVETENSITTTIDITEEGQKVLVAKGGNGGWGNWHFKSSIQQAPTRANPGLPGEQKTIELSLKLIADVGLLGLPNAGKSTFLSVVSSARPKIANYPFTTLQPQLGVIDLSSSQEQSHIIIADLPGLIAGASEGKGLGATFLKHTERTKVLLHLVDGTESVEKVLESYKVIRAELEKWSPELAEKPEIIAITKADSIPEEFIDEMLEVMERETKSTIFAISAITKQNIPQLLRALQNMVHSHTS